jgi:hypothetical protein
MKLPCDGILGVYPQDIPWDEILMKNNHKMSRQILCVCTIYHSKSLVFVFYLHIVAFVFYLTGR